MDVEYDYDLFVIGNNSLAMNHKLTNALTYRRRIRWHGFLEGSC